MLGMMVLLTAVSFIAPAFTRDLILGQVMWERRLATKVIESQLDQACNSVQTSAAFDALGNVPPTAIVNPPELAAANGTWKRDVTPINANLKSVVITVNWNSRRAFEESSAPYHISRVGLCGAGP
jgi:hypothetical protein